MGLYGVCTMSLFADYVKFYAKVEGQGVTLTFDIHVGQASHHLNKLPWVPRPQCNIPSFKTNSPLVPEVKVF